MKFITKQPIVNGGKIYKKNSIIDLTPKQARYLSDYIVAIPENVKAKITGEKEKAKITGEKEEATITGEKVKAKIGSNSKINKGDGK